MLNIISQFNSQAPLDLLNPWCTAVTQVRLRFHKDQAQEMSQGSNLNEKTTDQHQSSLKPNTQGGSNPCEPSSFYLEEKLAKFDVRYDHVLASSLYSYCCTTEASGAA